jgi:anti-sigma factor RsiW
MDCDVWQDKIDAFVDSELSAGQGSAFEEHLRICPACSLETLWRQRLKVETRLAGQRFSANGEFASCVRSRISRRRSAIIWLPALASAAAVLLVALVVGITWRQNVVQRHLVAQLVDQHVATMASSNPVDVLSTDSHTVKPWFSGRVPFSVDIPNLVGTQFELLGGRVAYLQQVPAAQLIFTMRNHRISVFMVRDGPETAALPSDTLPVRRTGFATETWVEEGIRYFVISDVNAADVRHLCDLLKPAGRT